MTRRAGLYRRVLAQTREHILPAEWRGTVGLCGHCGRGELVAHPLDRTPHGGVVFYSAACNHCKHEVVSPAGKCLVRSSAHSQMPPGWWAHRTKAKAE